MIIAALITILILAAPARGHVLPRSTPPSQMTLVERERFQVRSLAHARGAVRFLERHRELRWLSASYERELRFHRAMARWVARELAETRAAMAAQFTWLQTVARVGRYFGPAAAAWLRSCSQTGSEGGWGRFVMNTRGSDAGGWLQFMPGTFYGHLDAAVRDARRRGLVVPRSERRWESRLGQAVVGAHMWSRGLTWHWEGWAC